MKVKYKATKEEIEMIKNVIDDNRNILKTTRRRTNMKNKYVRNIERLRQTQGCLTDCIAYVFNLHPWKIPFFIYPRKDWMKRVQTFFRRRGYICYWIKSNKIPKNKKETIVCGNSLVWKTASHVVVYKNRKCIFDPAYPTKWKDSRITHILKVIKIR